MHESTGCVSPPHTSIGSSQSCRSTIQRRGPTSESCRCRAGEFACVDGTGSLRAPTLEPNRHRRHSPTHGSAFLMATLASPRQRSRRVRQRRGVARADRRKRGARRGMQDRPICIGVAGPVSARREPCWALLLTAVRPLSASGFSGERQSDRECPMGDNSGVSPAGVGRSRSALGALTCRRTVQPGGLGARTPDLGRKPGTVEPGATATR
jgi:hypothetical protein